VKKLVGQHDSQRALVHARRTGRENDPLSQGDSARRIDTIGDGDRGDVGPLRAGPTAGERLELGLAAGRGDIDVVRPVAAPERIHVVDRRADVRGDPRQ